MPIKKRIYMYKFVRRNSSNSKTVEFKKTRQSEKILPEIILSKIVY